MRIPDEKLDDYSSGMAAANKQAAPPRVRSLHFTGEVEVLKPVVSREVLTEPEAAVDSTFVPPAPSLDTHRLSVSYRSLAVAGALVIIALILASGIFIGIYNPVS